MKFIAESMSGVVGPLGCSKATLPVHFWEEDEGGILAGRDQKEGGTWLGITRSGRLAWLTSYREVHTMPNAHPEATSPLASSRSVLL